MPDRAASPSSGRRSLFRGPVTGTRAVVSAGSPLAASAAFEVVVRGGNAVDAVLAGSMAQCVVEWPWCGLGGDAFMLIAAPGEMPAALNGSGPAPSKIVHIVSRGQRIPRFGPLSVGTPGFVAAWYAAHARYGTRPAAELIEPAIRMASNGVPVDWNLAMAFCRLRGEVEGQEAAEIASTMLPAEGRDPGQMFSQPDLAQSLATLAAGGADAFYRGELAQRMVAALSARGGALGMSDLGSCHVEFVEPLGVSYRGYTVLANPPVSLGVVLLEELKLAERFNLGDMSPNSADVVDRMLWCKRAAFTDAARLSDPAKDGSFDASTLLTDEHIDRLHAQFHPGAGPIEPVEDEFGLGTSTTSIAVADASGSFAVMVHSNFNEFGSREVADGTGILMNDRLAGLTVDPSLPNGIMPGRRPLHTLNAYMVLTDGGAPAVVGATPGGRGQVQTNFQVVSAVVDHKMDLQAAVERPRWLSGTPRTPVQDEKVYLEEGYPVEIGNCLRSYGNEVTVVQNSSELVSSDFFGACTVVGTDRDSGALQTAIDPRRNVSTIAW